MYWYRKAAEQSHARAQYNLGVKYTNGEGVPEDDRQGVYWYRKAAEQGYDPARYTLGLMYALGEGIPEDYVQAYVWNDLAARAGFEPATGMQADLQKVMTPAQVTQAQALARTLWTRIEGTATSDPQ